MDEKCVDRDMERLDEMLEELDEPGGGKGSLIAILQRAQELFGYLPREVLIRISERAGIPISRVYGVVTFYSQFHLEPRGRNIIRSCQGTACHVRGAKAVLSELRESLGLEEGQTTTPDLSFTLETVACIGCCGLAPVIMVNEETHGRLVPGAVREIVDCYR
ncbi:MAG: NAD(P)H-dependent oxidoreductase subunit E [Synergistaceae bacterium]|jgi:NADH:ubiquinone oxidoreductase subunit E|nr:NAD(P)H-dependent oxidoreductase subunit E [Synergistaceae bacterium]